MLIEPRRYTYDYIGWRLMLSKKTTYTTPSHLFVRRCKERSDEAIQQDSSFSNATGLLRFARNGKL